MPERNSLWVSQAGGLISVEDARVGLGALMMPGSSFVNARSGFRPVAGEPGQVTPTPTTPDGNVRVAPFQYFLQSGRASVAGPYVMTLDAVKTINVLSTPANATNNRNDLIIAQQSDTFYADATSPMQVRQVVGTPSGTPVDPTVTGSPDYITLARVVVRANTTQILNTDITDLRPTQRATVALGGLLPVATQAVRDGVAAPYNGLPIYRQDKGWIETYDGTAYRAQGLPVVAALADVTNPITGQLVVLNTDLAIYRYTGSAWIVVADTAVKGGYARYTNNGTGLITIPASGGDGVIAFNNALDTSSYVTASGASNTTFTINRTGQCHVSAGVRFKTDGAIAAGPDWYFRAVLLPSGGEFVGETEKASMAYGLNTFFVKALSAPRYFTAGDQIQFRLSNGTNQTTSVVNAAESIFCSFKWMGP